MDRRTDIEIYRKISLGSTFAQTRKPKGAASFLLLASIDVALRARSLGSDHFEGSLNGKLSWLEIVHTTFAPLS